MDPNYRGAVVDKPSEAAIGIVREAEAAAEREWQKKGEMRLETYPKGTKFRVWK